MVSNTGLISCSTMHLTPPSNMVNKTQDYDDPLAQAIPLIVR